MSSIKHLIFFTFFGLISVSAAGQTATEVVTKMDEKLRGESSKAEITMTIVRPDWERSVSMKTWSKGSDYSLIYVMSPARDKGIAYFGQQTNKKQQNMMLKIILNKFGIQIMTQNVFKRLQTVVGNKSSRKGKGMRSAKGKH